MTAAMTAVMTTAVTAVTMSGERWHWKQHGSRDRANERELEKHLIPLCCFSPTSGGDHDATGP
jgi:hypothetical protein